MYDTISPTIQTMIQNTPQGQGNIPLYDNGQSINYNQYQMQQEQNSYHRGSMPSIDQLQQQGYQFPYNPYMGYGGYQQPPQFATAIQNMPYPSPKEMVMNGQNNIYQPIGFAPRNIVGGYNPGYNQAFANYSNPYMGYGSYGGFPQQQFIQLDPVTASINNAAMINGVTYMDQLTMESSISKSLSRLVAANVGRSEEETEQICSTYDIYNRDERRNKYLSDLYSRPKSTLVVAISIDGKIVGETSSPNNSVEINEIRMKNSSIPEMIRRADFIQTQYEQKCAILHQNAIERKYDNKGMIEFLTECIPELVYQESERKFREYRNNFSARIYDSERFRALLKANGVKSMDEQRALDRYVARYGYMPDGRPVSPGHDPGISASFIPNPKTGFIDVKYPGTVEPPSFLAKTLEAEKARFLESLNNKDSLPF